MTEQERKQAARVRRLEESFKRVERIQEEFRRNLGLGPIEDYICPRCGKLCNGECQ